MVTHCGQILVPSACAAFLAVDFINKYASEARRIRQEFERLVSRYSRRKFVEHQFHRSVVLVVGYMITVNEI